MCQLQGEALVLNSVHVLKGLRHLMMFSFSYCIVTISMRVAALKYCSNHLSTANVIA